MAEYPKELHSCLPNSESDGTENQTNITKQTNFINPCVEMHQREQIKFFNLLKALKNLSALQEDVYTTSINLKNLSTFLNMFFLLKI